jgi:ubiquinone/menaquinone biosynthesis C-methylase UbiE
MFEDGY